MRQIEARGRLLQKKGRKRIYLIIIISWSIRTSKKKTTADIFHLTDHLSCLSESSYHSILDFPFSYLSHSFTFFEYGELIISLRYIFISIFFLLDIFTILFTFEARSSILLYIFKESSFRYFDFNFLTTHVAIIDTDRILITVDDK